SGTADAPIVFRACAGETPVIDGTSLAVASGWSPLLWLQGVSHVTIQGFELRNYRTAQKNHVPVGILVNGAGSGVGLLDNHIHDLGTTYTGRNGGDAHGIAIYGDSAAPVGGLVIRGNHLHDLVLGSSEALVLNGNVDGFLVESNHVHDCNNIGIDCIGREGTCPDAARDAARNGVVRLNTIHGITSYGNPAYGNNYSAGGIYVDGGRDIVIERNTSHDCDIGVELASEHAGTATGGIRLRDNLIYRNRIGGLFMGGYDTARGSTENCVVEHNTFFENDTRQDGNGEIHLQFDVRTTVVRHNLLVANSQALVIGNPYTQNTGNTVDYNLVHAPGTPRWQWKKTAYAGWAAWRAGSAQDAHSRFADPLLLDPSNGNFELRPKSPAIDAGDPAFSPGSGETDHAGRPRVRGARTDMGAREFELLDFAGGGSNEGTSLERVANEARLTVRRRSDWAAQSLTFQVQTSTTLAADSWNPATGTTTPATTPVSPADGTERATFAFTPPAGPRWFARVRIDVSP
ncbi:MAG TPA: right-handed parallel beta-helix repeat-containing protein, partial [Rariglobus sp.]